MSRFLLAPSILAADFGRLADELRAAEAAGADWIHVDVMDGQFVPNISIGPGVVQACAKATSLPLDVHLMVREPGHLIPAFVKAGATSIGVHVEAVAHIHRSLQEIRAARVRTCVVINPGTPAEAVKPVLPLADQVLVMTVNPGFGGQSFIPEVMPKLQQIRSWIDRMDHPIDLTVDGGITVDTIETAAVNGANVFVVGSAWFGTPDYERTAHQLREKLKAFDH